MTCRLIPVELKPKIFNFGKLKYNLTLMAGNQKSEIMKPDTCVDPLIQLERPIERNGTDLG